ncbi:hypothetical protein ACIQLK_10430 [Microbacterium sp. NPDC091382]|uniref:hypothetical protein n=1 Tax=Microbacterium sp. NPDC091382 TaxID=3364210 RepID=UPI0037F6E4BA
MSTPDQPGTPPLTRRQLRELRNTASTPIITPEQAQADADASDAAAEEAAAAAVAHEVDVAPERTPVALADDAELDPDAHPVSRRQARYLAKMRTGAVDVLPQESETGESETGEHESFEADDVDVSSELVVEAEVHEDEATHDDMSVVEDEAVHDGEPAVEDQPVIEDEQADAAEAEPARVVAPDLGAQLLEDGAAPVELPPSFDQLLTRGGSGSASAPNALILSQTPETGSLSVPILGTGELIITGSYALPESFGSTGVGPGNSDGKDADAALIDGELPPASSPTPIAASSAISTIKSADEIIRPPAPEKGSRLIMTLAICAGALGLALATVLILTLVNGNF